MVHNLEGADVPPLVRLVGEGSVDYHCVEVLGLIGGKQYLVQLNVLVLQTVALLSLSSTFLRSNLLR